MAWGATMRSFLAGLLGRLRGRGTLASSEDATAVVLALFRGHGLHCELRDGWIVAAEAGGFAAQARIFIHSQTATFCSVQLDVEVRTTAGHRILESCGGFGRSRHEAIGDAIRGFCDGSFHVLVTALTGRSCSHCEVETWAIGGVPRRVIIGPMVCRGTGPDGEVTQTEWFHAIRRGIQESSLPPGLHWIRLYHFERPPAGTINEVLLDNETWAEREAELGACEWPPPAGGFYSVRVFLMIMDSSISRT
jgi:hypothetical protein